MRKYRLEVRSEVVLDTNYTADTAWFCLLQYETRQYHKNEKIAKLYSDILALVCRRFVAYILRLLSCGKLRNTTALPVSALEIVAACLLACYICRLRTAATRTQTVGVFFSLVRLKTVPMIRTRTTSF